MTGIGRPDVSPGGHMGQREPRRDLMEGRKGAPARHDASHSLTFGDDRLGEGLGENPDRAALFKRKIDEAMHRSDPAGDDKPTSEPQPEVLLAQSGNLNPQTGLAQFAPSVVGGAAPAADVRLQGVVDKIAQSVEQAVRADLRGAPGSAIRLHLQLDGPVEHIQGITVSLTADVLDITLVRPGGAGSPALAAAAQELADRLRVRFSKRMVRIHDGSASASEPQGGMQAIAGLLQSQKRSPP